MKVTSIGCALVACAAAVDAFVAPLARSASLRHAGGMRMAASDVTVPDLIVQAEELKLLSQASKLGLLGKLEAAGLTLKDVEKLLPLVDKLDVIGFSQAFAPTVLPLAPKALETAPAILPLLASAVSVPPAALFAAAAVSFAAGGAAIFAIPEDSVLNVAVQAFLAVPLLVILPGACAAGGVLLSGLSSGALVNTVASVGSSTASSSLSAAPVAMAPTSGRPVVSSGRPAAAARKAPKPAPAPKKTKPAPAPRKPTPKVVAKKAVPPGNLRNIPKAV